MSEGHAMNDRGITPEVPKEEGPEPIHFEAVLYPDGNVQIRCPLLKNSKAMFEILKAINQAVITALEDTVNVSKIVPPTKNPNFLNGVRRMK